VRDWRALDLAGHEVRGEVRGRTTRTGKGANVLGGPAVALTWLANELSGLGLTLAQGQVVTTGTCLVPLEIAAGDSVLAEFGALGRVEVRIGD
jgi:2-keto-4-pentenoate hydratase